MFFNASLYFASSSSEIILTTFSFSFFFCDVGSLPFFFLVFEKVPTEVSYAARKNRVVEAVVEAYEAHTVVTSEIGVHKGVYGIQRLIPLSYAGCRRIAEEFAPPLH
eukprot:gene6287-4523_t